MQALEAGVCFSDTLAEKKHLTTCNSRKVPGLAFEMSQVPAGSTTGGQKGEKTAPRPPPHAHTRASPVSLFPPSILTHAVLPGRPLLEGGREGNRGHHGQRAPLFGFLPHVDSLRGEVLERRQETGAALLRAFHSARDRCSRPGERRETATRERQENRMGKRASDRAIWAALSDLAGAISRRVAPLPARSGWQDQLP